MMTESKDDFWKGLQVLCFLLGLLIVFGTVGHIEMEPKIDYIQVGLNSLLGFILMWYGSSAYRD
jgi:hypothetical protein